MENINKGNIKPQFDAKGAFIKACLGACVPAVPTNSTVSGTACSMLQGQLKVFKVLPVGSIISRTALGRLAGMPMVKGKWTATTNNRAGNAVSNALRTGKGTGLYLETKSGTKGNIEYHYTLKRAVLETDYKVELH